MTDASEPELSQESGRQPVYNIVHADRVRHVETVEELAEQAVPILYVLTPDRMDVWAVPRTDATGTQEADLTYKVEPSGVLVVHRLNGDRLSIYSRIGWLDLTVASGIRSVPQN